MWDVTLLAFIFIFATVYIGFLLTLKKSKKRKYIIWGLLTIFIFTPVLSWVIGIIFGIIEGDGFAAIGMMTLLFPIIFIIGLILFLVGIFKNSSE